MFFSQPKKAAAINKASTESKSKLERAIHRNDFNSVKKILEKISVEDKKVILNVEYPIHNYSQEMLQTLKPTDNTEKLFSRI